ncbi:acyl-CoA dehydrogenase family protein [Streptomonospora nanhaiensis]|uniref:acyl-CoA dehydrogenase family protein n=1 Tax=Streptomonospora nanhaiensis TaxID=1323731 RepID=UPI001C385C98|nr:acyl-CoA dehydrogenase family protein [Streptomonospora nanhaiensis]MBV2363268.1 acyl-CoA/acyl-ACP dehydrogenase [Streptomonospora nanhaiensis]
MSEKRLDLLYTEVEQELRASVRSLLEDKSPPEAVLARVEGDQVTDTALWKELADIGVAGLPVAEELGGAGAGLRESAVVAEELGRCVAPVPFLGSAVLATTALLEAGAEAEGDIAALASGEAVAALAVPLATPPGAAFPEAVRAEDGALSGTVTGVVDAVTADVLVVPAVGPDGPGLYVVEAAAARVSPVVSLDLTRPLAEVAFTASAARQVASGEAAGRALRRALTAGAALLSAEQLGVAEWALETTVAYAKTRHQFGRPIGSFQAVKHRLADLWVAVSQARAVVRGAASAAAAARQDPGDAEAAREAELNAALAQAFVSGVAVKAAEEAVQLHGGIGFTWEHPAHLYLKRAKSDAIALGTADRHRLALARLVDLPAAEVG